MGKVLTTELSVGIIEYTVARVLMQKGFIITNSVGGVCEPEETNTVGLLEDKPNRPAKGGFLGFGRRRRRDFIGVLWIGCSPHTPEASLKVWVLDVYGVENMDRLRKLAEGLARDFNVDIRIVLKSHKVKEERFLEDGAM